MHEAASSHFIALVMTRAYISKLMKFVLCVLITKENKTCKLSVCVYICVCVCEYCTLLTHNQRTSLIIVSPSISDSKKKNRNEIKKKQNYQKLFRATISVYSSLFQFNVKGSFILVPPPAIIL